MIVTKAVILINLATMKRVPESEYTKLYLPLLYLCYLSFSMYNLIRNLEEKNID